MSALEAEVRRGAYCDSIVLLQLQVALTALPGVDDAGAVMGTPANLALLAASHLLPEGLEAGPDDLVVVVRAPDGVAARAALGQLEPLLTRRRGGAETLEEYRPRSLEQAFRQLPRARWVAISVPGRFATAVARQALEHGRNVFLYSDNVAVEDELALKTLARGRGLLVMGPDCGTAMLGGVGFGFANRVRRGPVGLLAASGTGLQAVACRLHELGSGVSQALGTGGRDLSPTVGGLTAEQALALLAHDPATRSIVILSKPPSRAVARRLLAAARRVGKPVVVNFQGQAPPARRVGNLSFACGLEEAAELAVAELAPHPNPATTELAAVPEPGGPGFLRALFSGGTLAYELLLGLEPFVGPLWSNLEVDGVEALPDLGTSREHTVLDLGEDAFTVGRLHPMMDSTLRRRRLLQEAEDPAVGTILLDLVLGDGAHPDPAAELAETIAQARLRSRAKIAVLVVGTDEDPQDLGRQTELLEAAGARVLRSFEATLDYLLRRLAPPPPSDAAPPVDPACLASPPAVVNVGLETFATALSNQGADVLHLDWRPPAGGDAELAAALARLR